MTKSIELMALQHIMDTQLVILGSIISLSNHIGYRRTQLADMAVDEAMEDHKRITSLLSKEIDEVPSAKPTNEEVEAALERWRDLADRRYREDSPGGVE